MFYERLKKACEENGTTVTKMCKSIGVGTSNGTYWKNGSIPNGDALIKISELLDISIDYLLRGKRGSLPKDDSINYLKLESTSQKIDYRRQVLHLEDDFIQERFKSAREAAGVSLEDAAACAYINIKDLQAFEVNGEIDLKKIDFMQLACLAYKYDVDLYWLICGKVRPPAAVVQKNKLAYPPYEWMLEIQESVLDTISPFKPYEMPVDQEMLLTYYIEMDSDQRHLLMSYANNIARGRIIDLPQSLQEWIASEQYWKMKPWLPEAKRRIIPVFKWFYIRFIHFLSLRSCLRDDDMWIAIKEHRKLMDETADNIKTHLDRALEACKIPDLDNIQND